MDRVLLEMARREIAAHPAVRDVAVTPVGEAAQIEFDIHLEFGDRWLSDGRSPTGVLPVERVRLDFSSSYPLDPPLPSYRPELGRTLAHVLPSITPDGRPIPCLVDGAADEFVLARGLIAWVEQFRLWLERAAANSLIDPAQGWEPMRRDRSAIPITVDRGALRTLAGERAGVRQFEMKFFCKFVGDSPESWLLELVDDQQKLVGSALSRKEEGWWYGVSYAFAAWVPPSDQDEIVHARYAPDDVKTVRQLMAQANEFRIRYRLTDAIRTMSQRWAGAPLRLPICLFFLVRRPFAVIGQGSDIEIIPYLTYFTLGAKDPFDFDDPVYPVGALDRLSSGLLRRMSGTVGGRLRWVAVGAGSLGSKIAMHLGRSGVPPLAVVDRRYMAAHNMARHVLYPSGEKVQDGFVGGKAQELAEALQGISQVPVAAVKADIIDSTVKIADIVCDNDASVVLVNTTAALGVREFLGGVYQLRTPVIDAELYDQARIGVLRCEGAARNPSQGELVAQFYSEALAQADLGDALAGASLQAVDIGEGCSSMTMVCSDAAISVHAAIMAEEIDKYLAGPTEFGSVTTIMRADDGLTVKRTAVAPWVRVDAGQGWTLSISAPVHESIQRERNEYLPIETGGILVGRVSRVSKTLYITDLIPAPADSKRELGQFVLGVEGVLDRRVEIERRSQGRLTCLGTWHSHAGASRPSGVDRNAAVQVGETALVPQAILVAGADGYECIFDIH